MILTGKNLALSVLTVLLPMAARADISGSNPFTQLATYDTCSGCIFAYVQFSGANAGQTVLSYQFHKDDLASSGNSLTPLLFEKGAGTFTIIGIGTTRTGFASNNDEMFGLLGGSASVIDSNTFFGYVDGDASGHGNLGTISTNYPNPAHDPSPTSYYHASAGVLTTGEVISGFNAFTDTPTPNQNNRTYSLQVTTTPEPALYGLMATGLGALVLAGRRKRTLFRS